MFFKLKWYLFLDKDRAIYALIWSVKQCYIFSLYAYVWVKKAIKVPVKSTIGILSDEPESSISFS